MSLKKEKPRMANTNMQIRGEPQCWPCLCVRVNVCVQSEHEQLHDEGYRAVLLATYNYK